MEIVVLEWILFFFPCLDKSFFNLIVTDGWKLVRIYHVPPRSI